MLDISHHNFNFEGEKLRIRLEKHPDLEKMDAESRKKLNIEINSLLLNCWGKFPEEFVEEHIFGADKMIVARDNEKCIGICVMTIREVLNLKVHYIEFLLVDKEYQKCGLGSFLSFMMIRQEIVRNLHHLLLGSPLEIFFITPNIRVLSRTAKFSSFIYPDPYSADKDNKIEPADEETWKVALELLKESDNPGRELDRNGLVLKESYANTPWLIYNNDTAPWHSNDKVNSFARKYLGYHNGEDREFMVRAHISLFSIFRYLFQRK